MFRIEQRAILALVDEGRAQRGATFQRLPELRIERFIVFSGAQHPRVFADDFAAAVARDLLKGFIGKHDGGIAVGDDDRIKRSVQCLRQQVLLTFGADARADVLLHGDKVAHRACIVSHRRNLPFDDVRTSVRAVIDRRPFEKKTLAQAFAHPLDHLRIGVRALQDPWRGTDQCLGRVAGHGAECRIDVHNEGAAIGQIGVGDQYGIE